MNRLFVNNLTVIDFSYYSRDEGIKGESWIVDIELLGELDEQGMVFDFGHVKKFIKGIIDTELDHRFAIPLGLKGFSSKIEGGICHLSWESQQGLCYKHSSPLDAIVYFDSPDVTIETATHYLQTLIKNALPPNVCEVVIKLRSECIEGPFYHYSHGLKKHDGNCQRIVHGHRSRIDIFENDVRQSGLEQHWADLLKTSYIGTAEDVIARPVVNGKDHIEFKYEAEQGTFCLTIPQKHTYIINTDSTVELIAAHIADECKKLKPNSRIEVRAYEGVGKGAIAVRD